MLIARLVKLLLAASFLLSSGVSQAQDINGEKIFCGISQPHSKVPAKAVYFIKNNENEHFLLSNAIRRMETRRSKIVLELKQPALSAKAVLPYLCPIAKKSVIAVVEYKGWYWFGDEVLVNDKKLPKTVIAGYAVKQGTTSIFRWVVW